MSTIRENKFTLLLIVVSLLFCPVLSSKMARAQDQTVEEAADWLKEMRKVTKKRSEFYLRYAEDKEFRNEVQKFVVKNFIGAYFDKGNNRPGLGFNHFRSLHRSLLIESVVPHIGPGGKLNGLLSEPKEQDIVWYFELRFPMKEEKKPYFGYYQKYLVDHGFEKEGSMALIEYMMDRHLFQAGDSIATAYKLRIKEEQDRKLKKNEINDLSKVRTVLGLIYPLYHGQELNKHSSKEIRSLLEELKDSSLTWIQKFSQKIEKKWDISQ